MQCNCPDIKIIDVNIFTYLASPDPGIYKTTETKRTSSTTFSLSLTKCIIVPPLLSKQFVSNALTGFCSVSVYDTVPAP